MLKLALSLSAIVLIAGCTQQKAAPAPEKKAPAVATETREGPDGKQYPVLQTILTSGIIIEDLRMGDGPTAMPTSDVTIHYHGTLKDGTPFDSTRGKAPATFPLPRLIKGWQVGIPGMKVGGIRRLTIPAALAYGERAKPGIPANSDLIFTIELLGVK